MPAVQLKTMRIGLSENRQLVERLYYVWLENAKQLGFSEWNVHFDSDGAKHWCVELSVELVDAKLIALTRKLG